ncbi:unnamed protein product [Trichobilharzia regenti]|nr:unnamed protein product [Trichobilharzia regenti]
MYELGRLLKFYNMNVEISLIVVWVTLVHHWPYHTAWLIIYLEHLNTSSSMNTNKEQELQIQINLLEAFSEVSFYAFILKLGYICIVVM